MNSSEYPLLLLPDWYDDQVELEVPLKGWFAHAVVQSDDGARYPVYFVDPVRLRQDLDEYAKAGTPHFAEPGLIVLPEVTTNAMRQAVKELWRIGYFDHIRPLAESELVAAVEKSNVD